MSTNPAEAITDTGTCRECAEPTERIGVGVWSVVPAYCRVCADRRHAEQERADELAAVDDLMQRAGATRRTREWSLDTYPRDHGGSHMRDVATAWLDDYHAGHARNLFLCGAPGCGKTGLAWGIVRQLLRDEFRRARAERDQRGSILVTRLPARLLDTRAYLESIRHTFGTGQAADLTPRRVPVLVLDDLGAERETEWAVEALSLLVAERYERELPTIVTSNYTPDELAERLNGRDSVDGQRLLSRLCDGAEIFRIDAPDRRVNKSVATDLHG